MARKKVSLALDDRNWIWLEDFKLPFKFYLTNMLFQFYDKNAMRSQRRGTAVVNVHLMDLLNFLIRQKKDSSICPVCFVSTEKKIWIEEENSEWVMKYQCTRCNFVWRHDEWT